MAAVSLFLSFRPLSAFVSFSPGDAAVYVMIDAMSFFFSRLSLLMMLLRRRAPHAATLSPYSLRYRPFAAAPEIA